VTALLREQLDHATAANQSLSAEVNKLNGLREEFEAREAEFKKEEQVSTESCSRDVIQSVQETGSFSLWLLVEYYIPTCKPYYKYPIDKLEISCTYSLTECLPSLNYPTLIA